MNKRVRDFIQLRYVDNFFSAKICETVPGALSVYLRESGARYLTAKMRYKQRGIQSYVS